MVNPIIEGLGKGNDLRCIGSTLSIRGDNRLPPVLSYDVVSDGRNVALGVKTAAIAGVLTGGVGLVGGALALKKKRLAVITWKGGAESLVEVRSTALHKVLVAEAFKNRNQ